MLPLSPEGCVVWKLSGNYFKESFNLRSSFFEGNVTMTKSLEKITAWHVKTSNQHSLFTRTSKPPPFLVTSVLKPPVVGTIVSPCANINAQQQHVQISHDIAHIPVVCMNAHGAMFWRKMKDARLRPRVKTQTMRKMKLQLVPFFPLPAPFARDNVFLWVRAVFTLTIFMHFGR